MIPPTPHLSLRISTTLCKFGLANCRQKQNFFRRRDDFSNMFVGHINMPNCKRLFLITCCFHFVIKRLCSFSGGDECVVELIMFGLKCAVVIDVEVLEQIPYAWVLGQLFSSLEMDTMGVLGLLGSVGWMMLTDIFSSLVESVTEDEL